MEIGMKEISIFLAAIATLWGLVKGIPMLFSDVKIMRHQKACRDELDEKFSGLHESVNDLRQTTAVIAAKVDWIKNELNGGHGDEK